MEDFTPVFIAESIELLSEELTPEQKKKVDSWGSGWGNPHKEVFGSEDRIRIPYDASKDKPITEPNQVGQYNAHHNIVMTNLRNRGYKTDDYASGVAYHESDPKRKYRIGSLVSGENDKPTQKMSKRGGKYLSLSQVYASDPIRAAHGAEKEIVISKHKYDVAGVSTDRGWTSCMDMDGGSNKHYLPRDIEHHTLAAYLVRKGENPDKSAIGRVSIKKFTNSDGHTIYRPESSTYGSVSRSFHSQVHEWATEKYPSKEGFYQKEASLYNDDGKNLVMEKSHRDSAKLHSDIESSIYKAVRDARNAHDENDWEKNPEYEAPNADDIVGVIDNIHNHLPHKDLVHSVIHHLVKNSAEDIDEYPDIHDNNADDKIAHAWAVGKADGMFGHHSKQPFKDFGPGESIELMGKLHDEGKEWDHYHNKTQEMMMDAHDDLIKHVFSKRGHSKEWDAANDVAIGHIATPSHEDYYHEMSPGTSKYLVKQTKNPRLIHTLLNNNEDERDSTLSDHSAMQHVGEHADTKLAHEMYHHPDLGYSHAASLIHGLNDNKHGEQIQHDLTSQMLLTGGHDHEGNDLSESHVNLHSQIAQHTKFKSVYDKIKARSTSDLDHPEIRSGLKANQNFHIAEEMQRYLRALRK